MNYPWLEEYLLAMPGVTRDWKQEWNWIRFMVGGKLFCALCLDEDGKPYYITLKLRPEHGDALRQLYEDILPGYYMNKTHWNSIKPAGAVPEALMRQMLTESYELILHSLPKKTQMNILEDKT